MGYNRAGTWVTVLGMTWHATDTMTLRRDFIDFAQSEALPLARLCARFGISRKTGYKWLARAAESDSPPPLSAFADRSRRPLHSPGATPPAMVEQVVALRLKHPSWGGRKLRQRLLDLGHGAGQVPAASTITDILRRQGLLEPRPGAGGPAQRFERAAPNELWQMDFKGHTPLGRGGRLHPLSILDDHSRYLIGLQALDNERTEGTQAAIEAVFRLHGLPETILCDNGSPWGCRDSEQLSRLGVWLLRLGVRVIHGRPYHPQTQGKDERFHRTLKADLLTRQDLRDLPHAQQAFDQYREIYNHQRPHEALGLATPASRYQPSPRSFPEWLPTADYPSGYLIRRVKSSGGITFKNRSFYIGKAFEGLDLAIRPTKQNAIYHVQYGAIIIGQIDLDQLTDQPKHIYRTLMPIQPNV